jgi:hypothetical protein
MAKTIVLLEPGVFFAGIDRPWYVSKAAVRDELVTRWGFSAVRIYPRSLALPVNPHADPRYGDGWDEWIRADFSGPPVKKNTDRLWSWLVKVPRAVAEQTPGLGTPAPEPPEVRGSAGALALVGVPLAAAWLCWSRLRR